MNIGDYLDLEKEKCYPSKNGVVCTVDVDALVKAIRADAYKEIGEWLLNLETLQQFNQARIALMQGKSPTEKSEK